MVLVRLKPDPTSCQSPTTSHATSHGATSHRATSRRGTLARVRVRLALVAAIALVTSPVLLRGALDVRVEGAPRIVGTPPVALYRPHLDDRSLEGETWDYVLWFPSGHRLIAQFQITSAGPGRHTGLLAAMIVFPDKTTRLIKNSRPRAEWKYEERGTDVRVSLVHHVLDIGATRHRLHIESEHAERFNVEADAIAPAVRLGPVRYGTRDRYELTVLAPRVRAAATLQVDGQPPVTLTGGGGIVLHSDSTLADYDQALNVMRLHTFDRPVETSLLAFAPPGGTASQSVGWLLSLGEGQPLEVAQTVERRFGGLVKEREDPGYWSPRTVQLTTRAPAPLNLGMTLVPVGRFDIIDWMNTALGRFVARRLFHPVQYLFDVDYELHAGPVGQRLASGKGFGLLWILNQPRGATF